MGENKKITFAIAGLGNRGRDAYAPAIASFPDRAEIVAVADVDAAKVNDAAQTYNISAEKCFASAEEMLQQDKLADAMLIATQDRQHVKQAIAAMRKGYHILLEKPVSPSLEECREIVQVAQETNRKVIVCHVLRYTPFYRRLKEIIEAGTIGDVVTIMGIENVGYWHQAHSFVRGNWNNSNTTSPMILQKCCHDMDLYLWLANKRCKSVTSYGSTYLFKEEKAPKGATLRCLDGCKVKDSCPFDAEKIYITNQRTGIRAGNTEWPNEVLAIHPTEEKIYQAIKTGPYGRCVYHCDNNVVDHQVLNLEMDDDTTMSFTMSAFTNDNSRFAKIMGTGGEIVADLKANTIDTVQFGGEHVVEDISLTNTDLTGHAGGDPRLINEFINALEDENYENSALTSLDVSVESHYVALGAEQSRLNDGNPVLIDSMR